MSDLVRSVPDPGPSDVPKIPRYRCRTVMVPTIGGDDVELWAFDCPECERPHYHGTEAGHRVAHCWHAAAHPDGYILESPTGEGWPE